MLDVIPPSGASRFLRKQKTARPSAHVLKVAWKLPARLRKPVRAQLSAERVQKKARLLQGFHRRPLTTQPLAQERNDGVEQRTADIYRESEPTLRLVAPPYVGSVIKGVLHESKPASPPRPTAEEPVGTSEVAQSEALETEESRGVIQKPRRKLRLPFSMSLIPKGLLGESVDLEVPEEKITRRRSESYGGLTSFEENAKVVKKKIFSWDRNVAILLIGCLLASGVVWNLRGAGRGWQMIGRVEEHARGALASVGNAQAALAEADFAKSEAAFADAEVLLATARQEMDMALSASAHVLKVLDVTGTVRSGEALLTAGESLSQAGQHVSRGMAALLAAQVLSSDGQAHEGGLVEAVERARNEFTEAQTLLTEVEEDLREVESPLLPQDVRTDVAQLKSAVPVIRAALTQFLDQTDTLLFLLGAEREREYLLLFANNHELRPVGGFIGSIGVVHVDRGLVEAIDVKTVYDSDGQLKDFIAPPEPLAKIVDRWYLRDSNWFVSYKVSAQKAAQFFEKEGGSTVDGVILLTPEVIRELVRLAGPIAVPGYDVVVTADNFTEVTQREVTYEYDRSANRPKQFLADLTPILLNRLFQKPEAEAVKLLSTLTRSLAQKDLVLFFRDGALQARAQQLGWAGGLPEGTDAFLMVNNANIGGHKSDQFIDQEIDYRLDVGSDGETEAVVTIRRTHRGPSEAGAYAYPPGEDPATKDNVVYQRVLVPLGAQLLEAQGFTPAAEVPQRVRTESEVPLSADPDVAEWQRRRQKAADGTWIGEEAGFQFFANWIVTKPGQTMVSLYRYRLPKKADVPGVFDEAGRISAYVAKQPGAARTNVRVSIGLPETMQITTTAPAQGVTPLSLSQVVYRGDLTADIAFGAVFERQ